MALIERGERCSPLYRVKSLSIPVSDVIVIKINKKKSNGKQYNVSTFYLVK